MVPDAIDHATGAWALMLREAAHLQPPHRHKPQKRWL
jgi:hypothetical protein